MLLDMIKKILESSNLKPQYLEVLLSRIDMYEIAFTTPSFDSRYNYEMYEKLGDTAANKFLVWYFYRRFPQFHCPNGVKIISRLQINYASGRSFAVIADKLGFWPYIRIPVDKIGFVNPKLKRKYLEDIFEAFIGVTELILDEHYMIGVGFNVIYSIMESIFDKMDIGLEDVDLFDAKSRLKELFDIYGSQLGTLIYEETAKPSSIVYRQNRNGQKIKLGEGYGSVKADREIEASRQALEILGKEGYERKRKPGTICDQ